MQIRTRFAPSPTGYMHLGNLRTAFFCWLYARRHNGKFILRIEDTDQERSKDEWTQLILKDFAWLGLEADEGPFYQTKRMDIYKKSLDDLMKRGLAYRCYCDKDRLDELRTKQLANKEKPRYDGCCRDKDLPHRDEPYVIRFKNPLEGEVTFKDLVVGELTFSNHELDDLIIYRSDGFPTYNFAVVVDDAAMQITHVVRGAGHVNNTPRQINICHALGIEPPTYAHLPLVMAPNGKPLGKRNGAKGVFEYRDEGILPEALLNYLVRLGWSHGDQEIFSRQEMIDFFDLAHVNRASATFSEEKLLWLNRHYIKNLPAERLAKDLKAQMEIMEINIENGPELTNIVEVLRERAETIQEMAAKSRYFYEDFEDYEHKAKTKYLVQDNKIILEKVLAKFEALIKWEKEDVHQVIIDVAEEMSLKLGKVAQPIRVAVTGGTVSPAIDVTLKLIGKIRAEERMRKAINSIKN